MTYLDGLVLERLVRIVHVLERDAVELSLVDVRYPVVLPALGRADRALQVVLEPNVRVAAPAAAAAAMKKKMQF